MRSGQMKATFVLTLLFHVAAAEDDAVSLLQVSQEQRQRAPAARYNSMFSSDDSNEAGADDIDGNQARGGKGGGWTSLLAGENDLVIKESGENEGRGGKGVGGDIFLEDDNARDIKGMMSSVKGEGREMRQAKKDAKKAAREQTQAVDKAAKKVRREEVKAEKKVKMQAYLKEKQDKKAEFQKERAAKKATKLQAREARDAKKGKGKKGGKKGTEKDRKKKFATLAEYQADKKARRADKQKIEKREKAEKKAAEKKDKEAKKTLNFLNTINNPHDITEKIRKGVLDHMFNRAGESPEHCPLGKKKCKNFDSLISLNEGYFPSGMTERLANLRVWAQVAASLCARLEVPKPCEMLSKGHHHSVDKDAQWEDFVDIRLLQNNMSIFAPEGHDKKNGRVVIPSTMEENDEAFSMNSPKERIQKLKDEGKKKRAPLRVALAEKYKLAKTKLAQGKTFHWHLNQDWLNFDWLHLHDAGDCNLLSMDVSKSVKAAAQKFYETAKIEPNKFITLHLRRSDFTTDNKDCDTQVTNVVYYVNCTLKKEGWFDRTDQPLVIFMDEKNAAYRKELLDGMAGILGRRMVLLGDPMLEDLLGTSDNAFVFQTSLYMRRQAEGELFLDRTQCEECGKVCRSPCRGDTFDEYVMQTPMYVTAKNTELSSARLLKEPPTHSCPTGVQTAWKGI